MDLARQRRLIVYLIFQEHLRLNERIRRYAMPKLTSARHNRRRQPK